MPNNMLFQPSLFLIGLQSLFLATILSPKDCQAAQDRPNILLLLSDDQGYGDLPIYGNEFVKTPNLQRLASESVVFRNFHAQPVCSPTRAELMTGRRFLEVGVWGVHGGRDYLDLSQQTIADYLSSAGYATAMLGKWHLGKTTAYLPYNRGFDESWSITERLYEHIDPVINHNGIEKTIEGWTPEILTDLAIDYMARKRDKPFFLYVAYPEVHEPWVADPHLVEKYQAKGLSLSLATVFAMNEQLDLAVGRLVETFDAEGIGTETVIIYVGDNGPIYATSNGLENLTEAEMSLRNPEGLRGLKGNLYENGTRVPGLIRWTKHFEPREVSQAADVIDIVPTLLELAGAEQPKDVELRGQSLIPLLENQPGAQLTRPVVYGNHETHWPGKHRLYDFLHNKQNVDLRKSHLAIRAGTFKLVQTLSKRELFDLSIDPSEQHNINGTHPDKFQKLSNQLNKAAHAIHTSPASYQMPVFPIGFGQESSSYLYACAPSQVFGKVETNSHSIDNWRQNGDSIRWKIRVDTPGTYQISAKLDADPSTGQLQLSIGNQELTAAIGTGRRCQLGSCRLTRSDETVLLRLTGVDSSEEIAIQKMHGLIFERK